MGWSLTGRSTDQNVLFDEFFLILGRALYLATEFEAKCRYILRLRRLVEHFDKTRDAAGSLELVANLKDGMLGRTIAQLEGMPGLTSDTPALERARDARNFIAHESAGVGSLWGLSSRQLDERLQQLRVQLRDLAEGDDLVCRWIYVIEEKQPVPSGLMPNYAATVLDWVFGGEARSEGQ